MNKAKLTVLAMLMVPMLAFSHADRQVADGQEQTAQAEKSLTSEVSVGEIRKINKEPARSRLSTDLCRT